MKNKLRAKALCVFLALTLLCGCSVERPQPVDRDVLDPLRPAAPSEEPAEPAPPVPPAQPPAPQLTQREIRVRDIMDAMTPEEKVGQLFLARCPSSGQTEKMAKCHLGGYLLFKRDFQTPEGEWLTEEAFLKKIGEYNSVCAVAPFIATDEEGGVVTRASQNPNLFPTGVCESPRKLYAEGGLDAVMHDAQHKGARLLECGINLNLAPVADVCDDPNAIMYRRSFGGDPLAVAEYVRAVVGGMSQCAVDGVRRTIGSALKHFPGYGANVDTHVQTAVDERPLEAFTEGDLLPFQAGIDAGAGAVLVSHNIVTCMDPNLPASLSPASYRILREALHFEGVCMTDDLVMDALDAYTEQGRAPIMALQAGADLMISTDFEEEIAQVTGALERGELTMERIEESVARILNWKLDLGIIE